MKNAYRKKALVVGIIAFFIEASVVSGLDINSINSSQPLTRNSLYISECNEKQSNTITTVPRMSLDQDPRIADMIQKIDEDNIYSTVYSLQNCTTRYYGTSGNIAASTWIYNKLSNITELTVEYQGGEDYRNVIATLPGKDETSTSIYVVGAHYDTVDLSYAPGACDNGAGVAIVLEFARIMSQYTFNHTVIFALWNAEEGGASTKGSHVYVDYAIANDLNIALYINFDSSCYDPDNQFILDIIYNDQSQWVSDMMTQYNTLYNISFTLTYNVHLSCWSDHKSFWGHDYTAVATHSETHGPAHSPDDTVDKVSTLYAKKNGQLGMSVLAYLSDAQQNENDPPNIPLNPIPANDSTNVSVYAYLSWIGGDPDGDPVTYDVYFGTMNPPEKVVANLSATMYFPVDMNYSTTYYWRIVAWDNQGNFATGPQWEFTTKAIVPNTPPNKPDRPSGETNGKINTVYTYTTKTIDIDGDRIYYNWSWGDDSYSGWLGPFASNTTANGSHTWTVKGSYAIKVKAKDPTGNESAWSDPLAVSMPLDVVLDNIGLQELLYQFPNAFPVLRHLMGN